MRRVSFSHARNGGRTRLHRLNASPAATYPVRMKKDGGEGCRIRGPNRGVAHAA